MLDRLEQHWIPSALVRLAPWWAGALAAVVGAHALLSLRWGIIHDAPLMYYAGREIANGASTAVDLFELNTPLVHWLHAAIYIVFGLSDVAWRTIDLAFLGAIVLLGYRLIEPLAGRAAWLAVLGIAMFHLRGGDLNFGQRDMMLLVPVLGAGLLLVRIGEARSGWIEPFGAGALLATAALVKPSAAIFAPFMTLALLATTPRLLEPAALASFALRLAIGFGGPCLAMVAVLHAQGALVEFLTVWQSYLLPVYGKVRGSFADLQSHITASIAVLASLAGIMLVLRILPRACARLAIVSAIAAAGLASYLLQGKGWYYQAVPFNFAAVLLATVLAVPLWRDGRGRWLVAGLAACLMPGQLAEMTAQTVREASALSERSHTPSRLAASLIADLDAHVPRDMPVQILDTTYGGIEALLRSGRRQPTRFIYDFQFYLGEPSAYRDALRSEFLARLAVAGPHALVVTNQQWPGRQGFSRTDDPTEWPELNRRLKEGYVLVTSNGVENDHGKQYRIYRSAP